MLVKLRTLFTPMVSSTNPISPEEWERWRNAIHTLYILDDLPLGGSSGVIEMMKLRYGFCATKRQYEYRFQQWGLEKYMPGGNYPIIASKLGKRKAAGTESNVFWKGELVPAAKIRKETTRHGYMTTLERLSRAQEPESPETPLGVEICTPPAYPVFRRVFEELPILKFLRSEEIKFIEAAQLSEPDVSTLGSVLIRMPADVERPQPGHISTVARSLIPFSAFENELPASSTVLGDIHHNTPRQVLVVAAYLISNNFPGDCNRTEIHKWLKRLYASNPAIFQSLHDPSNQALLQGLLRLAVEEGDAPMAGALLGAGADPNGNTCVDWPGYWYYPVALTPLQYSCFRGNVQMVKELLRAKAQIDHPEFGWSCSPLLFAICGFQQSYYDSRHPFAEQATIRTSAGDREGTLGNQQKGRRLEALIALVCELLNAGANVNAIPEDLDHTRHPLLNEVTSHLVLYCLMREKHSALTLGAAFRCPELVDLLIQNGAHVDFHINGARSALRECLYTSDERSALLAYPCTIEQRLAPQECLYISDKRSLRKHLPLLLERRVDGSILRTRVVETAMRLIMAKVNVNDHQHCGTGNSCKHRAHECYSALDLGILTQDKSLVNALWSAGAKPTYHAWDIALEALRDFDIFCQLLNAGVPLPRWAFTDDQLSPTGSREATGLQKRRAMILAATWLGACTDLERLTASYDCSNIFGSLVKVSNCTIFLDKAVEECCRRGYHRTLACLLQSGILPRGSRASVSSHSVTLAIRCAHWKIVDVLLEAGADVTTNNNIYTHSPLQLAIEKKSGELVRKLIDHGASAESPCAGNLLVSAIQCGDRLVTKLLMEIASLDSLGYFSGVSNVISPKSPQSGRGWLSTWCSPLAAAICREQWDLAEELLQHGASVNTHRRSSFMGHLMTPLWASVFRKNSAITQRLIDSGAEVNDEAVLKLAATEKDPTLLKLLVEGLSTDKRRSKPNALHAALQCAVNNGHLTNARLIIESKLIDLHALNSPLLYCEEFLQLLREASASPDVITAVVMSPSAVTSKWNSGRKIGTDVQEATMEPDSETLRKLLQHGANPNLTSRHCRHTALQIACRDGSLELVELLLEYGGNVNAPPTEPHGATALQFAAIGGYLGIAHLLLEKGADVNAAPAPFEGRTAFEGAAEHGRNDMVQLLKNAGADISEAGQGQYERAWERATKNGHLATRTLLRSYLS